MHGGCLLSPDSEYAVYNQIIKHPYAQTSARRPCLYEVFLETGLLLLRWRVADGSCDEEPAVDGRRDDLLQHLTERAIHVVQGLLDVVCVGVDARNAHIFNQFEHIVNNIGLSCLVHL